jgi:CheY-like chemotaxis protein
MSHEVRTPLAGILGTAELMADAQLNPEQRRYVEMIRDSGQGLLNVINDILSFSQSQVPAKARASVVFSPAKMMQTQVEMMRSPATHKGIGLTAQCSSEVPERVFGDSGRIAQVLLNLLSNAIKFTHQGVVHVGVERVESGRIRFFVRDSGIGLDADAQKRLFNPYVQADASIAQKYGGTGLGLAISRDLVRQMGGEMHVDSEPGKGATFSFELPLHDAQQPLPEGAVSELPPRLAPTRTALAPTQAGPSAPAGATPRDAGESARVLVVEDNKTNQLLMKAQLSKLGVSCQIANQGLEALDILLRREFELILMDCQMPEMDGYTATRAIRERERISGKRVPIVAVTANVMVEDRKLCESAGMDAYLAKPFSREELKQVLERWLPSP